MHPLAATFVALLREPEVRSALREALGAHDDVLTLERAAQLVGTTRRALRDEARRGRLAIEGPRSARVVRRVELDRWLAARAPVAAPVQAANDGDEDAQALAATVARVRRQTAEDALRAKQACARSVVG